MDSKQPTREKKVNPIVRAAEYVRDMFGIAYERFLRSILPKY